MSRLQYTIIMKHYNIEYVILPNGKKPIIDWLNSLDNNLRKRINQRILRIEEGNFGDYKILTKNISELRLSFGKGYRVYYSVEQDTIVLLINGGDKSTQQKDISNAEKYLTEWRNNCE